MNIRNSTSVIAATIDDYPLIQNMARFYVYDLSRYCGYISKDWALPDNGLYECFDFRNYFTEQFRKAYLVKVHDEIAGFVLLNKAVLNKNSDWNMGEFFILGKFQGKGIAGYVAQTIWKIHSGKWEVAVIPENKKAIGFWEKAIKAFTNNNFKKSITNVDYDVHQSNRIILEFETK